MLEQQCKKKKRKVTCLRKLYISFFSVCCTHNMCLVSVTCRPVAAEFMGAAATGPMFLDWEVSDNISRLKEEVATLNQRPDVGENDVIYLAVGA